MYHFWWLNDFQLRFDAEYLRNRRKYRHSYNGILLGTYTRPTQGCHFEWPWVSLSDAIFSDTKHRTVSATAEILVRWIINTFKRQRRQRLKRSAQYVTFRQLPPRCRRRRSYYLTSGSGRILQGRWRLAILYGAGCRDESANGPSGPDYGAV